MYGAEGVQGATGKPPGRARRHEIFYACKYVMLNLQKNEAENFVNHLPAPAGKGIQSVQVGSSVYTTRKLSITSCISGEKV